MCEDADEAVDTVDDEQGGPEVAALCTKQAIGNGFQNIDRAREKFARLSIDPFVNLNSDTLEPLRTNIQKRHVIGHNLGITDEHYVELTQADQPGETVRLIGDEIAIFADICLTVITALEPGLPGDEYPSLGAAI